MGGQMMCQVPECEYPANPDRSVCSEGFCCDKCEGRFNGEEWAMGGKKKHTAYCTSKTEAGGGGEDPSGMMGYGPAFGGGGGCRMDPYGGGKGCGKMAQMAMMMQSMCAMKGGKGKW